MAYLNDILAALGHAIAVIIIVFTGATTPVQVDEIATTTVQATIQAPQEEVFTMPTKEVYNAPKSTSQTPQVIVIPVVLPQPTSTPAPVYTNAMPEEPACVEDVQITSFIIGTTNTEINNVAAKNFSFVMHGTSKCSNTFDVAFTSDVKIHSFNDKNEMVFGPETYSVKDTIESNIKTDTGYVINKTASPGYIIQPGTYNFKVTISKDGKTVAMKDATLTI